MGDKMELTQEQKLTMEYLQDYYNNNLSQYNDHLDIHNRISAFEAAMQTISENHYNGLELINSLMETCGVIGYDYSGLEYVGFKF
jgi:hypothetical protein